MASGQLERLVLPFTAGADITQYQVVKGKATEEGVVVPTTLKTDLAIGVACYSAKNGERISVQVEGLAKVRAGVTTATANTHILVHTRVQPSAAGKVEKVDSGAKTQSIGRALNKGGVANELITIYLRGI